MRLDKTCGQRANYHKRRQLLCCHCAEADPDPFEFTIPPLLAVPSLTCSVASLSQYPGDYLPGRARLHERALAAC